MRLFGSFVALILIVERVQFFSPPLPHLTVLSKGYVLQTNEVVYNSKKLKCSSLRLLELEVLIGGSAQQTTPYARVLYPMQCIHLWQ